MKKTRLADLHQNFSSKAFLGGDVDASINILVSTVYSAYPSGRNFSGWCDS